MSAEYPFTSTQSGALPLFQEWAWDFERNCFIRDGRGEMILLSGVEALQVWIQHALRVERWAYLAYSDGYGIELQPLIGKVLSAGERKSELRRVIVECLMANPYITSVNSVNIEENERGRVVGVAVELSTVYGALTV